MRNVERDLRSSALRFNADGETLHRSEILRSGFSRRSKLALKPANNFGRPERIGPVALLTSQRARSFAAGSQREPHQ
jgi:hypothetical protein